MYQDLYYRAKNTVKKMHVCNSMTQQDPFTYASGDGLGARLVQVRDVMNCGHDEVPDNALLCPTAFASKSLLSGSSTILFCLRRMCHQ